MHSHLRAESGLLELLTRCAHMQFDQGINALDTALTVTDKEVEA